MWISVEGHGEVERDSWGWNCESKCRAEFAIRSVAASLMWCTTMSSAVKFAFAMFAAVVNDVSRFCTFVVHGNFTLLQCAIEHSVCISCTSVLCVCSFVCSSTLFRSIIFSEQHFAFLQQHALAVCLHGLLMSRVGSTKFLVFGVCSSAIHIHVSFQNLNDVHLFVVFAIACWQIVRFFSFNFVETDFSNLIFVTTEQFCKAF